MNNIEFGRGTLDGSECVSTAWELIKRRYGLYLGVTLLTMVLATWLSCISWVLLGPIWAGIYYIVTRDLDDEPIEFGMMFKGFEKFVPLMMVGLIASVPQILNFVLSMVFNVASLFIPQGGGREAQFFAEPTISPQIASGMVAAIIIGMIIFLLFFIAWSVTFFFVVPLTFEYDLSPGEAIKLSAKAAWANFGGLVVLAIMNMLVGLLGMLMICVGIFLISIPVATVAYAVAYRQVFPRLKREFINEPPPPTAYGNFGSGMQ